ncbi:MAG: FRG domain-containing protein [Muribaculaceae bacterium]|nr:FRG domain-containing protein [Muribaculaceae bacterium]
MVNIPEDDSIEFSTESNIMPDIPDSELEDGIMTLPVDFKITTCKDIKVLREFLSNKFCGHKCLYRGHESDTYQLASTLARNFNEEQDSEKIAKAERKICKLFYKKVYKKEWKECKPKSVKVDLFRLSIARHLGMSCRLIDLTASLKTAVFFAVHNPEHYHKNAELIVLIFDEKNFAKPDSIPFTEEAYHLKDAFLCDRLDELPLGEYRRFKQNGHFIFVGDAYLSSEKETIKKHAKKILKIPIPSYAKISLAKVLWRDVYGAYDYKSDIEQINNKIKNQ